MNANHIRILQAAMRGIMLRRGKESKLDGKPIITLPKRIINFDAGPFTAPEQDFYDALEKKSMIKFNHFLAAGTVVQNYTNILVLLMRLRQACDHPNLIPESVAIAGNGVEVPVIADDKNEYTKKLGADVIKRLKEIAAHPENPQECPICLDVNMDKPVTTTCGHLFCDQCIRNYINMDNTDCPSCRKKITVEDLYPLDKVIALPKDVKPKNDLSGEVRSSTKIDLLLDKLAAAKRDDPQTKTIVFSQFTKFFDLIEHFLSAYKYNYARYDGSLSLPARAQVLNTFKTDKECTVLLMSLKSGSLGLNLVCASRIIMLDPWWNPAVEDQAIDRSHRIGQTRDVQVSRLTISGTVEDRIIKLQEKKRALAAGALGDSEIQNMNRLSLNDLKYLFRGGNDDNGVPAVAAPVRHGPVFAPV